MRYALVGTVASGTVPKCAPNVLNDDGCANAQCDCVGNPEHGKVVLSASLEHNKVLDGEVQVGG